MKTIFHDSHFLDFHTHTMRQADRVDVMEIVSLHLGQDKPHKYFTVGLHPWWAEQPATVDQRKELERLLTDSHCLAMGEMGLDNLKGPEIEVQMDILRSQLKVADEMKKPVIIHCVRAFGQLSEIKKEFPGIEKWCVHGYGRHATLAKQLIDQGFYLSLMPGLPPAKYMALFESLPHDRLFLETDSMPDISIIDVYETVAGLIEIEMPELQRQMNSNARTFFEYE
ncbi:TatD family hydrolase [uncultured Imperialibacter sp.]|uniref:TatD family hydrolase n=1 Tax=uncultured Imperialibacter sp. TaxID=1672639 RepID=UPI0030D7F5BA